MSLGAGLVLVCGAVMTGVGPAAAQGTAPAVPGNLRVVDVQANHATVSWDASAGADEYLVRQTGATNRNVVTSQLTQTLHLQQGQTYQVAVAARGPGGQSALSGRVVLTTLVDEDNPPVTAPDGFQVDVGVSSVTVQWEPSATDAGVTVYHVEVAGTLRLTEEPRITLHLQPDRNYQLRAQARDAALRRSDWSEPVAFSTPDEAPVTTPAQVQVSESPGAATVTWAEASSDAGVRDYLVSVQGAPGGPFTRRTTQPAVTFEVPPGGDLEVKVQARDTALRVSDFSDLAPATVPPAEGWGAPDAPDNLRPVLDSQGQLVRIAWDATDGGDAGPVTYRLQMEGNGVIEQTQELQVENFGFTQCPANPSPGQSFLMSVTATSAGVESPASEPITLCF